MATAKKNTTNNKKTTTNSKSKASSSKQTTSKTTQAKTKQEQVTRPEYVPSEHDIKIQNEIKLLIALAAMILVFISNFGLLPPLGDYVSHLLFGLFGFISARILLPSGMSIY